MGHHVTACHPVCCDEDSRLATGTGISSALKTQHPISSQSPDLLPITSTSFGRAWAPPATAPPQTNPLYMVPLA